MIVPTIEAGRRLRLPDGRSLGYAEFGDPDGAPVLYLHGIPGVRIAVVGSPDAYRRAGIRLVTVDRPGCGVSSRNPQGSLLDWPGDVTQLADALGLDRFAIVAESGGAPFALACAYAIPRRLTGVTVSSGAGPMDRRGARRGIKPLNRAAMRVLPNKGLSSLLLGSLGALYLRWPDFVVDSLLCHDSPEADMELLALAEVRDSTRRMLAYATGYGVRGLVDELALLLAPWGFEPGEIPMGIHFWHGDADNTVPLHHAEYLASVIRGSSLVVCPGEGHLVMERHLDEVLTSALEPTHHMSAPTGALRAG